MTTRDPVEEIKNKLDVKDVISEYIKLDKSGVNFKAQCPFHQERTPSFFVSPSRQLWRCFGCGEGGDMFTFVERMEGLEFRDALARLAQKAGVQLLHQDPKLRTEKNKSKQICALVANYFHHQLESKNGKIVKQYLNSRGINDQSIETFKLGYAPVKSSSLVDFLKEKGFSYEDIQTAGIAFKSEVSGDVISRFRSRIMFPIFNTQDDVVAFGGRKLTDELADKMGRKVLKDSAKYINSPQTNIYNKSNILYGLNKAKIAIRQKDACIVTEGYTDVILAHQEGYKNVVASSGTSLTEQQLNLINRFTKNLITSFDMDLAGDSATRRGIDLAQSLGFDVKIMSLPDGKDPADIIFENKERWDQALKNAKSVMQFYFDSTFDKFNKETAEGKRDIGSMLVPPIANIPSQIEQSHWIQELATKLAVGQDTVWEEIKKIDKTQSSTYKNIQNTVIKKPQTSRKELLAQQILLSVLKNKTLIGATKTIAEYFDEKIRALRLLQEAQSMENFNYDSFVKKLNDEDKLFVDQLLLEADIRGGDWTKGHFSTILNDYKKVILEEELKQLEIQIKAQERAGDEKKVKELLNEFNKKVQKINNK